MPDTYPCQPPGGEAARPRRACRTHGGGSPCKGTSAASASGAGGDVSQRNNLGPAHAIALCPRVQRIDKSRSGAEPAGGGSRDGTKREAGAARGPRPPLPPAPVGGEPQADAPLGGPREARPRRRPASQETCRQTFIPVAG